MLILSPRAARRLESHRPAWPMPKLFRLTRKARLDEGVFAGETINTPSMLCVEDWLDTLRWASAIGGLEELRRRADGNFAVLAEWVGRTRLDRFSRRRSGEPLEHLGVPEVRPILGSPPSTRPSRGDFAKRLAGLLEKEGAALDIGGHRDAPAGPAHLVRRDGRRRRSRSPRPPGSTGPRRAARRASPRLSRLAPSATSAPGPRRAGGGRPRQGLLPCPRVLIADKPFPRRGRHLPPARRRGRRQGRTRQGRAARRSSATMTAWPSARRPRPTGVIAAARRLKVIGRAGIGVDNVDIPAATAAGVVVMNTPFGNSITTAEHAIAMMFALARQLPAADASTQAGKWEKNRFHRRRAPRQDPGPDRRRQHRLHRRRPRQRPEDEGDRLRPLPVAGAGGGDRGGEGRAGGAAGARRHHHPAHAADRQDPQHPLRRGPGAGRARAC